VVEVRDGFQAIKRYQEEFRKGRPFQAVILDHSVKDGMGGIEAMRNLLRIDPDVKVSFRPVLTRV
jgi:CheY-like chemotaxis protein